MASVLSVLYLLLDARNTDDLSPETGARANDRS
jgi:hypothetical protein